MPSNARRIAGLIQLNDFDGQGIGAVVTEKELNSGTLDIRADNAVADTSLIVPVGNTANRPSSLDGSIRYNTDLQSFEGYSSDNWAPIAGAGQEGVNIINDTSTNANRFITFSDQTSGEEPTLTVSSSKLTFNPSSGRINATQFSGNGSLLTSLNASNISSGTISDDRLPATISSDITGNAATATTAVNSDKLDGLNSSDFLRSNTTNALGTFTTLDVATDIRHAGDTNTRIVFGTDTIDTRTNGVIRTRIKSDGKIGVGTTSPTEKLDVAGNVKATSFLGDGSQLTGISAGATGGGNDQIFYENGQVVTANYTITAGNNAMSAGPIEIADGVIVDIPDGSVWSIV